MKKLIRAIRHRIQLLELQRKQRSALGTAEQAIQFAVAIDDHYDRLAFLTGWLHGDLTEWPDYVPERTI